MNTYNDIKEAIYLSSKILVSGDPIEVINMFYFYMGMNSYAAVLGHITPEQESQLQVYALQQLGLEFETLPPKLTLIVDNKKEE
jgi:hypothetical protein